MTAVGADEAKTRLLELLRGVQAGERYTITHSGVPIAELVPVDNRRHRAADAVERMKRFMTEAPILDVDIKALIEAGRR